MWNPNFGLQKHRSLPGTRQESVPAQNSARNILCHCHWLGTKRRFLSITKHNMRPNLHSYKLESVAGIWNRLYLHLPPPPLLPCRHRCFLLAPVLLFLDTWMSRPWHAHHQNTIELSMLLPAWIFDFCNCFNLDSFIVKSFSHDDLMVLINNDWSSSLVDELNWRRWYVLLLEIPSLCSLPPPPPISFQFCYSNPLVRLLD